MPFVFFFSACNSITHISNSCAALAAGSPTVAPKRDIAGLAPQAVAPTAAMFGGACAMPLPSPGYRFSKAFRLRIPFAPRNNRAPCAMSRSENAFHRKSPFETPALHSYCPLSPVIAHMRVLVPKTSSVYMPLCSYPADCPGHFVHRFCMTPPRLSQVSDSTLRNLESARPVCRAYGSIA